MRSSLAEFEKLHSAPVLLVSDLDLIVFANSHAQEALLNVDVVDMPIQAPSAIGIAAAPETDADRDQCGSAPQKRSIRHQASDRFFQLKLDMELVSGIALLPRHPNL